jgi:hypothetical protein
MAACAAGPRPRSHVRASAGLLIWHEHWLRRPDFTRAAAGRGSDGTIYIDWPKAARFAGTPAATRASTSERAILDLAIAFGTDIYRFGIMGTAHFAAIAQAVTAAVASRPAAPRLTEPSGRSGAGSSWACCR